MVKFVFLSARTFLNLPKASELKSKNILLLKIEDIQKVRLEDLRRKFCGEAQGIFLEPKD